MKKLSLVLLSLLCACCLVFMQGCTSKKSLFTKALDMMGKGVPSGWIEDNGSYWNTRNFRYGKEFMMANVDGNTVVYVMVGCMFNNDTDQSRWLRESYDMFIADDWELVLDDDESWFFLKGDILAGGVSDDNDGNPIASVVFQFRN